MNGTSPIDHNILECYFAYSKVTTPFNYFFLVLFVTGGIVAVVGNTVALIVLFQPQMRSKSNRILASLAVSDALIGYIIFPFVAYQLVHTETLSNCQFKIARDFIVYANIGVSAVTVAIIAYDRYILLTKVWKYDSIVTTRKLNAWISVSWIFPICLMVFNTVGKLLDWNEVYYISRMIVSFLIALVLTTCIILYCLIARTIKRRERILMRQKMGGISERLKVFYANRHMRLAKKVSIIILCYIVCYIPGFVGVLMVSISVVKEWVDHSPGFHHFSLFTLFMASFNSCLNPIIYGVKCSEFRKCLRKTMKSFKRTDRQHRSNSVNKTTVTSASGSKKVYFVNRTTLQTGVASIQSQQKFIMVEKRDI